MSNEEESLLALLCESLSNGQRGNAPIFINFNSFNGPVGQHNDHADTVNFSMDKDGTISFQHIRRTGKSIIQPEVMAKALERTMEEGYWWASTAWAVAYRIYQMEGFTGSIRQFVPLHLRQHPEAHRQWKVVWQHRQMERGRCNGADATAGPAAHRPSKLTSERSKKHSKCSNNASKAPTIFVRVFYFV